MKKIRKLLTFILVSAVTATSIISCGNSKDVRKGRYMESEINIPDNVEDIVSINERKDKVIDLVSRDEVGNFKYYQSKDERKSWDEVQNILPQSNFEGEICGDNIGINDNGDAFISYSKYTKEQVDKIEELKKAEEGIDESMYSDIKPIRYYMLYKKGGETKEIDLSALNLSYISKIKYAPNGDLFILDNKMEEDGKDIIYQLDKDSFKVKNKYEFQSGYLNDFCFLDNELVVGTYEEVIRYDLKNGKKKSTIKELKNKAITSPYIASNEKDTIYYLGSKGLYSYKINDKKPKLIIDGSLSTLGDESNYCVNFIKCKNGDFLGAFINTSSESQAKLIRFKYDKNALFRPEKQLTLYSLYEDYNIKQAIVNYQKKNSDVYINYEVGIDYEDMSSGEQIKTSDIIKSLNTEIMAGKGPDIILLDGIPSQGYKDKNLLSDLSSIIKKKDGKLFDNITKAYTKDGKIYSYPLKFSLPKIVGKDIEGVSDLKSLAEKIDKMGSEDKNILDIYNENELLCYLYNSCSSSWIKNKKVDEAKLKEFLECSKKIYDKVIASHTEESKANHEKLLKEIQEYQSLDEYYEESITYGGDVIYNVIFNNSPKYSIGAIRSVEDLSVLSVFKEKHGVNNNVWNGTLGNYCIPTKEIAITKGSKNKDVAKKFVESLFDEDFQSNASYDGFPINKVALEKSLNIKDDHIGGYSFCNPENEEESVEINVKPLSKEESDSFLKGVESVEVCATSDLSIYEKIKDDIINYIAGKTSVDEAIKKVKSNLEIYLSE